MAKAPSSLNELHSRFGPHLNYTPPGGWTGESGKQPEKLVKTHCCFCGQQCGIQLKVRDNRMTGFEPWEDFPFNRGMLCPKGVKRYLQGSHPDRLLDPLMRSEQGFRQATWDEALDFTARRLGELQEKYGKDSVAVYGGASLTTEKAYLMGKFARVGLGTRHIDYNGRLCMVSAGTAYKSALGVDRAPNPWNDISEAEVLMVIGANIGECAPITTDYIWRARDKAAKLIVADPRFTPIARNADLYLPVRPGTDLALLMAMLHVIIRDGLTDQAFIEAHTTGFEKTAESVEPWNPRRAGEVSGVAPEAIEKAAHWIGESRRAMLMHARGLEHQSKGVENCEAAVAIALATGNIGRQGAGPIMVTGQGNGQGGREHGQKCDQLPGQRSLTDPAAREHVARVWGISPEELPARVNTLIEERRKLERELTDLRRKLASGGGAAAPQAAKDLGGVKFMGRVLDDMPAKELKSLADDMKKSVGSGVVAVVARADGKASIVVGVTEDLTKRFNAVEFVRVGAEALGGKGGGGRPDMAQAGGPDAARAEAAVAAVERAVAAKAAA